MKRSFIGSCLFLLAGYLLIVFLDAPVLNLELLKVRGFCRFCDLTNVNLEEMDFNGADLYYANLAHADLRRVNLTGTDLSDVNFFNSTMPDGASNNTNCRSGASCDDIPRPGVGISKIGDAECWQ